MAQLLLITLTADEFRLVALELGQAAVPFLSPPNKLKVIRIDLSGEPNIGQALFQQTMAQAMLFNTPVIPPDHWNDELAYSRETRTPSGITRQAIFVDSKGLDYSLHPPVVPERTAPGPLFVQNPECDGKLDAATATRIDVSTHIAVSLRKFGEDGRIIKVTINLPQFAMQRLVQRLTRKDIISPPRRKLNYIPGQALA